MSEDNLPAVREPATMLSLIGELARDPAVDHVKLEALLRMQERLEDRQREAAFNAAYAQMQPQLPRITKRGRIEYGDGKAKKGASIPFARWEDIMIEIEPIMERYGFGITFNTTPRTEGGLIVVGKLKHRDGHSETASIPLPLDTSGGKNNLQGYGSAFSYGCRYTARMLLNLVFEDEDDDGVEGGKARISEEQLKEVDGLRRQAGMSVEKFCEFWNCESIFDLDQANFVPALNGLSAMIKRKAKPE